MAAAVIWLASRGCSRLLCCVSIDESEVLAAVLFSPAAVTTPPVTAELGSCS